MLDIVRGVAFLHANNVVHRDIKSKVMNYEMDHVISCGVDYVMVAQAQQRPRSPTPSQTSPRMSCTCCRPARPCLGPPTCLSSNGLLPLVYTMAPQNILLGRDGRAKVADVGLAKLYEGSVNAGETGFVGTFAWAGAPPGGGELALGMENRRVSFWDGE